MSKNSSEARAVDWEKVEALYRVNTMSLREIGTAHGITEGAIRKRAKRDGWTRDLAEKVRAKADALVRKALVRSEVRKPTHTEAETVEVEASVAARIRLAHRADIGMARSLVMQLMGEVKGQTDAPDLFQRIEAALVTMKEGDEAAKEAARPVLTEALLRATSVGSRIGNVKSLVEAITRLVGMEREAYGIDDKKRNTDTAGDIAIFI